MDPPPIPQRNSKTKLTFDSPPCHTPISLSPTSVLPPEFLRPVGGDRSGKPPVPPSPMTELEIALHHKRQSIKMSAKNSPLSPTSSSSSGSLKTSKNKRDKNSFLPLSPDPPSSTEVQILFGDDHVTYSFEENIQNQNVAKPNPEPHVKPFFLPPSKLEDQIKTTSVNQNFVNAQILEEFNICSPPNDLLASCLNELSDMTSFLTSSQKVSETDSIGSNFSLQELSHLRAPSFPDVESTDSLIASVRCDSISGLDDLDALIADLDEMTFDFESPEKISRSPEKIFASTHPVKMPATIPAGCQTSQRDLIAAQLSNPRNTTQQGSTSDSKEAKISLALSKLRQANKKRLVLKIYDINMSYKMVIIDEQKSARNVCTIMAEKNHQIPGPNWCLVECLTALGLERTIEDHEFLLNVIAHWPRQHTNLIIFKNVSEKYLLLKKPQLFMPAIHPLAANNESNFDDATRRRILIKELFYDKTLPPISNVLNVKIGKKGSWRKIFCILRTSGLYYSKSKRSSTKDLVNLVTWKKVGLYKGQRYTELYKSPEKFCCALVPSGRLDLVEKSIVHMCFPTKRSLEVWMACISLAKYSSQLVVNYQENFDLYPWLENEGEMANAVSEVTPRSQESALTTEEKQMLHNELQMNSLANPLIDSLDVLEEKKNKLSSTLDLDSRETIKKNSKIAASFSNAWAAGDAIFPPAAAADTLTQQSSIDPCQPFSYTQGNAISSKFTLV